MVRKFKSLERQGVPIKDIEQQCGGHNIKTLRRWEQVYDEEAASTRAAN
jgi:hypothetical protein